MSITLEVTFTGLCMYVLPADRQKAGIIMPDGRSAANRTMPDNSPPPPPHIGYLRCDVADLLAALPDAKGAAVPTTPATMQSPRGELVHRFDGETLDFGVSDQTAIQVGQFVLPDLSCFAPQLRMVPGIFGSQPPADLLMRAVLNGGTLAAAPGTFHYDFIDPFGQAGTVCGGAFADEVTWTRTIESDHVTLTITKFNGSRTTVIPLKPTVNNTIRIKVANLCADNPLEWLDLGAPVPPSTREDVDFRYLYLLLQGASGATAASALPPNTFFPVPVLDRRGLGARGIPPGCKGLMFSTTF